MLVWPGMHGPVIIMLLKQCIFMGCEYYTSGWCECESWLRNWHLEDPALPFKVDKLVLTVLSNILRIFKNTTLDIHLSKPSGRNQHERRISANMVMLKFLWILWTSMVRETKYFETYISWPADPQVQFLLYSKYYCWRYNMEIAVT